MAAIPSLAVLASIAFLRARGDDPVTFIQKVFRGNSSREALRNRRRIAEKRRIDMLRHSVFYGPGYTETYFFNNATGEPLYADYRDLGGLRAVTRR